MSTRRSRQTTVRTATTTEGRTRGVELTWEEEMVVRMRKGLGENHDHALPVRGASNPDTRARLALLEAALLRDLHDMGPLADASDEVDQGLKNRILSRLAEVDED